MSLKIYITNIKVNNISNIGSLNIGKTIICRNEASEITQGTSEEAITTSSAEVGAPSVGSLPTPTPAQVSPIVPGQ